MSTHAMPLSPADAEARERRRQPASAEGNAMRFFANPRQGATLAQLLQAVRRGPGLTLFTGRPGVGKSLLAERLARSLEDHPFDVVAVTERLDHSIDLVNVLCDRLGLRRNAGAILQRLCEPARPVVLIVDHVDDVEDNVLRDTLSLLTSRDLIQPSVRLVLVGGELLEARAKPYIPGNTPVRSVALAPLRSEDVKPYLAYLHDGNSELGKLFAGAGPEVYARIASRTRCVPGTINTLATALAVECEMDSLTSLDVPTIDRLATAHMIDESAPAHAPVEPLSLVESHRVTPATPIDEAPTSGLSDIGDDTQSDEWLESTVFSRPIERNEPDPEEVDDRTVLMAAAPQPVQGPRDVRANGTEQPRDAALRADSGAALSRAGRARDAGTSSGQAKTSDEPGARQGSASSDRAADSPPPDATANSDGPRSEEPAASDREPDSPPRHGAASDLRTATASASPPPRADTSGQRGAAITSETGYTNGAIGSDEHAGTGAGDSTSKSVLDNRSNAELSGVAANPMSARASTINPADVDPPSEPLAGTEEPAKVHVNRERPQYQPAPPTLEYASRGRRLLGGALLASVLVGCTAFVFVAVDGTERLKSLLERVPSAASNDAAVASGTISSDTVEAPSSDEAGASSPVNREQRSTTPAGSGESPTRNETNATPAESATSTPDSETGELLPSQAPLARRESALPVAPEPPPRTGPIPTDRFASGSEDEAMPMAMALSKRFVESGGSLELRGLPEGSSVTSGTLLESGAWRLDAAEQVTTDVTPPRHFSGGFDVEVALVSAAGETASRRYVPVRIIAAADPPQLEVSAASGDVGEALPLQVRAALRDRDGSEALSIRIEGLPDTVDVSVGRRDDDGHWNLRPEQLPGLYLTPRAGTPSDLRFRVVAVAVESSNGDRASAVRYLSVSLAGA